MGQAIITRRGGTAVAPPAPSGWQPHPDWYNIKAVYDADVQEGYSKRYIYLLPDTANSIVLSGGDAYKTSDGEFYTSNVTHTWDRAHDKPCSDGYKTRWVIVYNTSRDVAINHRSVDSLWLYLGDCNVTSIQAGANSEPQNRTLQAVQCGDATTGSSSAISPNAFYRCYALKSIDVPYGVTYVGSNGFYQCHSLSYITLPISITQILGNVFLNCYALQTLTFPCGITDINTLALQGTNLVSINLCHDYDANLTAGYSPNLSLSSMLNMFAALKDNTGLTAKTLTLGATNLAKLTEDEKAIATNKNWVLA